MFKTLVVVFISLSLENVGCKTSHRITYNDIRCVPKVFYCVLIVVRQAGILFHKQEAIYIMLFAQFNVI